jgi:ketosteroid isomerase-like protein
MSMSDGRGDDRVTYPVRHAPAADIEEILRLHREWWEANRDCDIPRMVKVFPSPGAEYLMFNLNGHPYFGMTEKVALWEFYRTLIEEQVVDASQVMRLEVRGDTAWLACEGIAELRPVGGGEWTGDSVDTPYFRATEIYHRDDGEGGPQWRMWHFHCSPLPPLDETRPGFEDSTQRRGLGWVPWQPLPVPDAGTGLRANR